MMKQHKLKAKEKEKDLSNAESEFGMNCDNRKKQSRAEQKSVTGKTKGWGLACKKQNDRMKTILLELEGKMMQ